MRTSQVGHVDAHGCSYDNVQGLSAAHTMIGSERASVTAVNQ